MPNSLTADSDALLHTQLWIDPMEEFVHYSHSGDPVDITFGVKELKVLRFELWNLTCGFNFYF